MKAGQPLKLLGPEYDRLEVLRELENLHKRVNEVFSVGDIQLDREIVAPRTTGAKIINKIAGVFNFAAGASSLIVTNSFVNENSLIFCTIRSNDATAIIKNVVCDAGRFTVRLNAAATAETPVGFFVLN